MKDFIVLVGVLAAGLFAPSSQAYVTYNRLGYVSCAACHFISTGGGLTTAYGQGVQGSMSAFPTEVMPASRRFFQGINLRVIELDSTKGSNPFIMQADYLSSAILSESLRLHTQVGPNLKQGANGIASVPAGWDGIVLRRAMVTADLKNGDSIEIGRDSAVAGLNIDDHTSFLRLYNRRGETDYPTQIRYVYQSDSLLLLPYLAAPSFEESDTNQEYGLGARGEYLLNSSNSIGLETLYGNTSSIGRTAIGAFIRLSEDHWNGLSAEYVFTHYGLHAESTSFTQQDFYIKPYVSLPEWIETGLVYEHHSVSSPIDQKSFQYGPSINMRVNRYLSFLGDGRNLGMLGQTNWSWYGQVFVHVEI